MSRVHQANFSKHVSSTGVCDMPYERSCWNAGQDGLVVMHCDIGFMDAGP